MVSKLAPVTVLLFAALTLPVQADPPPGKGNPNGNPNGNPSSNASAGKSGNSGKGNQDNGNGNQGKSVQTGSGQSYNESKLLEAVMTGLVVASITQADARNLALQYGLTGYSSLPPGIQKNLARGKPLPPGIAKKTVPGAMLSRLPQYPGYEWRVAGTELILVSLTTRVIADVLNHVFD